MTSLSNDEVFKDLLERLEISIVYLSDIYDSNRLDSEYYKKSFIAYENKVKNKPYYLLSDIAEFLIGPFGSAFNTENYIENGIYRYIRGKDVKPFILLDNDNRYISQEEYNRLIKYALKENDIMISVVGTLGNACIIKAENLPAIFSCKSTVIRAKTIMPYCLLAYLNCIYGRHLLIRNEHGANQKGLNLPDIQELLVPDFSIDFQRAISDEMSCAYDAMNKAKQKYSLAENILVHELGLDEWMPDQEQITVRSFKDIFDAKRIDAEYYQPKYNEFENHIIAYKNGYTTPREQFDQIKTKCLRNQDRYPYVEIGDVDITTGESNFNYIDTDALPANAKIMAQKGDLLISTVRPYRGAVSILRQDNILVSSAFTVLRGKGIYPVQTLQVLLRTKLYKEWLLKYNVGTSYPVIKDEDVLNIPIPIFDNSIHKEIEKKVIGTQKLLKQSAQLLESTKRAVEIAIEINEKAAFDFLNNSFDKEG